MHSSVCGPHRDMVCSSCKTSNPITVSGLNHSYPYKTRLAVIISVKIFRIYVNIKEFSFTGAAWSVSDRRDPTQVLGHRGWLPAAAGPHPAATWPNTGTQGRQAGRMHRQRKKPRNNCEDVWKLIIFFFRFGHSPFFFFWLSVRVYFKAKTSMGSFSLTKVYCMQEDISFLPTYATCTWLKLSWGRINHSANKTLSVMGGTGPGAHGRAGGPRPRSLLPWVRACWEGK